MMSGCTLCKECVCLYMLMRRSNTWDERQGNSLTRIVYLRPVVAEELRGDLLIVKAD
jgi:hypothetical protein